MLKQHSFSCFICHHSTRQLSRLCTSLFKAKMIKRKPSPNLLSPFHFCKSKGQIYLLSDRLFLLTFRYLLLKIWGVGGEGKSNCFPDIQQIPVFYTVLSRTVFSLQVFSMKQGWLVGQGAAKSKRTSEKPGTRKIAAKGALSWSRRF